MDSTADAELSRYKSEREALWSAEDKSRWDHAARASASQLELRAAEIVVKIREYERRDSTLFGGNMPGEAVPHKDAVEMGGRFLRGKSVIDRTRIFSIAKKMPKGVHQHLHFNSEIPAERLLEQIKFNDNLKDTLFIRSSEPLIDPNAYDRTEIVFQVLTATTKTHSLYAYDYNGNHRDPDNVVWMRWTDFQRQFPEDMAPELDGTETWKSAGANGDLFKSELNPAERWARGKMVVSITEDSHPESQTHNGAWACFNQGTRAFKGMLGYESIYRWYIGEVVESMIRDKVMFAELRPMLLDKHIPSDDGLRQLNHSDQMRIILEEVEKKQKSLELQDQLDRFPFGLKIIYCTPRSIPREKMRAELHDCLALKKEFPDLVCGFDLVGAEDRPNNIGYYADLLLEFQLRCKAEKLNVPFMFHAGETLIDTGGSADPKKSNLYDALLLHAKRIGHGYALLKHPYLIEKYKEQNICLELCPISNELLHLCGNVREHKFAELLAAGLHCTLNADNPSLFRSSLSHEFYQVMVGDPRMTIHGWKQLATWSIDHSCLSDADKVRAREYYAQDWEVFCQGIVDEYADFADGLPVPS